MRVHSFTRYLNQEPKFLSYEETVSVCAFRVAYCLVQPMPPSHCSEHDIPESFRAECLWLVANYRPSIPLSDAIFKVIPTHVARSIMNIMVSLSEEWQVDGNEYAYTHAHRMPTHFRHMAQHALTRTHATQEDLILMFIADDPVIRLLILITSYASAFPNHHCFSYLLINCTV